MAITRKQASPAPSPKASPALSSEAAHAGYGAERSPVHALQSSIAASWSAPSASDAGQKAVALGSLVAIAVLGLASWTPIAATAFALTG